MSTRARRTTVLNKQQKRLEYIYTEAIRSWEASKRSQSRSSHRVTTTLVSDQGDSRPLQPTGIQREDTTESLAPAAHAVFLDLALQALAGQRQILAAETR